MTTTGVTDRRADDQVRTVERVQALLAEMTTEEKLRLTTGYIGVVLPEDPEERAASPFARMPEAMLPPAGAIGTDGFVPGVARLGIPDLQVGGSGAGVTNLFGRPGGASVAFPSPLAQAATWNPSLKRDFGRRLGAEARSQGLNVMIAGAANVIVEPRGGRSFEYHGEDAVLSGSMVAEELVGTQEAGMVATLKHVAGNFQETARFTIDTVVDERSFRETELLSFEIAVRRSGVGAVMGSYNLLDGTYACENEHLLTRVLREDWGFDGWVMSDWGAAHSTVASALAGLDQEAPPATWFGPRLAQAVESGEVPIERLDEMVANILRPLARLDLLETDGRVSHDVRPFDRGESLDVAQAIAEEAAVLLTNDGTLPLREVGRIAVIGAHADIGVPSGGGSAAVEPFDGALDLGDGDDFTAAPWLRSAPVDELAALLPSTRVAYVSGEDHQEAADAAAGADVAIVFAHQPAHEGSDAPDLLLPDGQDDLVRAVAAASPRVVVVLETGGVVRTPWLDEVSAVLQAWYPGHRGGRAIARLLTGVVNPSGKLPVTVPRHESDLPYPVFPDPQGVGDYMDVMDADLDPAHRARAHYDRGLETGYKWFARTDTAEPELAFGHGLSYTAFEIGDLEVDLTADLAGSSAAARVRNVGGVRGAEVVQVYATPPPREGGSVRRLVGWTKVVLDPGEEQRVRVDLEPRALCSWDVAGRRWLAPEGGYAVEVGSSSTDVAGRVTVSRTHPQVVR